MASRTYLTADFHTGTVANPGPSMNRTEELAQETFRRYMLQIFNPNIRVQINPPQGTPSDYLTTGAVSTFDLPMDIVGQITGQTILELTSESFLGKEPTRAQCAARTCFAMTGTNNCDNMDVTLYDDGC